MHLAFFVVRLLRYSKQASPSHDPSSAAKHPLIPSTHRNASLILRVLAPITNALTAKAAMTSLQECMESLGSIGYLSSSSQCLNIARLLRDANVLSIWEGTADIMATNVVKVINGRTGRDVLDVLEEWVMVGKEAENYGGFYRGVAP
ncbi:MAG: hypothetical protein LQ347_006703 [Umbilicaria vellea]|nr:MAG: hypothetical protein LQ347_006703 [Umbilicaria vellea]